MIFHSPFHPFTSLPLHPLTSSPPRRRPVASKLLKLNYSLAQYAHVEGGFGRVVSAGAESVSQLFIGKASEKGAHPPRALDRDAIDSVARVRTADVKIHPASTHLSDEALVSESIRISLCLVRRKTQIHRHVAE